MSLSGLLLQVNIGSIPLVEVCVLFALALVSFLGVSSLYRCLLREIIISSELEDLFNLFLTTLCVLT